MIKGVSMKRFARFSLIVLVSVFVISGAFADLYKPHRIFEIGFDNQLMFANSSFGLKDIMQKKVEIDLEQIASDMPKEGFKFNLNERELFLMNLNASSRFRFGFYTGVESYSNLSVSKDLFDLLSDGMAVGESHSYDISGCSDMFFDLGLSFQTIIMGYGVKFNPTFFIPLVYVPKTTATAKVSSSPSGLIRADAEANVDIYTAVDMHDFMEIKKSADNLDLSAGKLIPNTGFDFSFEIERNWMHGLNAGLYARIPVVAGKLKHKMSTRVWAYFYETNALGYLNDTEEHKKDHGRDDFTYSSANYSVHRPLKLGLNASYTPYGEWFKIQPALGIAVRNPYSSDAIFYPEYALDLRFGFLRQVFNFNIGTAYQNQIFQQRLGFALNLRALEIITQASLCGTTLKTSFSRHGYGALVGLRIGF